VRSISLLLNVIDEEMIRFHSRISTSSLRDLKIQVLQFKMQA